MEILHFITEIDMNHWMTWYFMCAYMSCFLLNQSHDDYRNHKGRPINSSDRGIRRIFLKGFPLGCGYISTHFKEPEMVQIIVK